MAATLIHSRLSGYKTLFMKKLILTLVYPISLCLLFSACIKDKVKKTYTVFHPVIKQKSQVLNEINGTAATAVQAPGKFYLYGKYIFLNDINKGVHVIDNSNPANPKKIAFLSIPGSLDIAIKGNTLYTDFFSDLLALDISNPLQVKMTKMLPHSFPERRYANGFVPDSNEVIVDWIRKDTTIYGEDIPFWGRGGCVNCSFDFNNSVLSTGKSATGVPGVAGSMSRFAVVNNYLYAVNSAQLNTHNITNPTDPIKVNTLAAGGNLETIYQFKDKLFIGAASAMSIIDISNPASPTLTSRVNHFRACDPVIADDKYAYVTLHSPTGTAPSVCGGVANQLDIVNIETITSPFVIKSYPLTSPQGLTKDNNFLFVCDGSAGLKIFDVTDPLAIKPIQQIPAKDAYDVVAWNKTLYLVAADGFYQYDYTNINQVKLLSRIAVDRK